MAQTPTLSIPLSLKPMEAEPVEELPIGKEWLYEPKYDGFRCLAFRDGDQVELQSKKQKSLNRFFPEVGAGLARLKAERFVLDGELLIPGQSFETLQLRLHPAASRISELSGKFPARLIVFDLLQFGNVRLTEKPLSERREALKAFVRAAGQHRVLVLSKATRTAATARRWLAEEKGLDGIVLGTTLRFGIGRAILVHEPAVTSALEPVISRAGGHFGKNTLFCSSDPACSDASS